MCGPDYTLKAMKSLREGVANGKSLTPLQARYMGWVAGGRKANGGIVGYKEGGEVKEYANGGEIKGKGTAKSASIKAKVEEGAFVVPAENSEKAKAIREELLESPADEKAELNHKGGVDVKLSNGEHLFTKEEADELRIS